MNCHTTLGMHNSLIQQNFLFINLIHQCLSSYGVFGAWACTG
uniref:Uncharacterized protein n=1 Tax=Rhizophora mucronata TaxID=61149 RepID=A0A2P2NPD8_RHIMU